MAEQAPWLVAQRYEVGEMVGRGGYGMVCRGHDRETGSAVAIKLLSAESGKDPDVVERMLREQQALVALKGTAAVTTVELCRLEGGAPCLIMEWLDGRDLEEVLAEREAEGKLGEAEELLAILKPVTDTLERAHELGLFHRDIKPANIFLTERGPFAARLLDFGLSRMKSAAPITAAGMVMGSPSYIAPETWSGDSRALDGRADLFSLAVIVFRWLTGKLPFDAPDLIAKMTAVTSGPRPSVLALRPDLPPAVDVWMHRALAVNREDRYQTGSDFFRALQAALFGGEYPIASAESSGIRPVNAEQRKGPLSVAWGAATSLLKRITSAAARAPEDAPVLDAGATLLPTREAPTPPEEVAAPSERHSVWLEPEDLEDVLSERVPSTPPVPAPPVSSPSTPPAPVTTPAPRAAKRKGKKKSKPRPKAKKAKAKKGHRRSKKSH